MAAAGDVRQYIAAYEPESDPEWEGEEPAVAQLRFQKDVSEQ